MPILYVSHHADDGAWVFLTGDGFSMKDAMLVSLEEVVQNDNSVNELYDLPLGWMATRISVYAKWERKPKED